MTHQAVADHFNVSRITISRLMIRLRQTGRTNDRLCSGRPRVRHKIKTSEFRVRLFAEDYLNLDSVLGVR